MNNTLLASYNTLSNDEQLILQALSVVYAPVGQTEFQELLTKTVIFPRSAATSINKPLREKLHKAELIVVTADGWQCHPDIVETLTRLAFKQSWFDPLAALLIAGHRTYYSHHVFLAHTIKLLRIYLYQGNETGVIANIKQIRSLWPQKSVEVINKVFFNDFDADRFAALSEQIKFFVLAYLLDGNLRTLTEYELPYQLLEQYFGATKSDNPEIVYTLIEQRLLRGNFNDAESWLAGDSSWYGLQLLASTLFLQNRNDEAVELFTAALKALKKQTSKRNISLNGLHGVFLVWLYCAIAALAI